MTLWTAVNRGPIPDWSKTGLAAVAAADAGLVCGLHAVPRDGRPAAVTVGAFDGVHRGHQALLARCRELAAAGQWRVIAVTFDRHPSRLLRPQSAPLLLTRLARRVGLLAQAGADLVVVMPFTRAFAGLSAEAFVSDFLVGQLHAAAVVVGANFRFGHKAAGDVALLEQLGRKLGVHVEGVDLSTDAVGPLSSSRLRRELSEGHVEVAATLLGRPHLLDGRVVRGAGRGRLLGVPTANIGVPPWLAVPGIGVYAGHLVIGEVLVPAVTSVGRNPTFGDDGVRVEAHALEPVGDLYGRRVALSFEHRLRDEERFPDVPALVAQMQLDISDAWVRLRGGA